LQPPLQFPHKRHCVTSPLPPLPTQVKNLLADRETLGNLLTAAHDTRVGALDAREDGTRAAELKALHEVLGGARADEYTRNRNRVVEVWNLVNVIHKKELEHIVLAREAY
jgi:hypothetical protein